MRGINKISKKNQPKFTNTLKIYIKMATAGFSTALSEIRESKEIRNYMLLAYLTAFLFLYLFYKSVIFSCVVGCSVIFTTNMYKKHLEDKRREMLKLQFRDLLYSMSASYASGRQLGEAVKEGYDNLALIYGAQTPMMQELALMERSINENHGEECVVLQEFAKRSGVEDIRDFADIYTTCRATGGSIEKVIDKTAIVLIEKLTIEREIRAFMAQKKLEGVIIFIMPIAVIFFLNFISPQYLAVLYECVRGRVIMTLGLVGMLYAGIKIKTISDVRI